ncbi:hypothetical protein BDQ12DRAFT_609412 [Crucibulum laeve]|uniref:Uncharacterized protein n=1 Tax=Crucibulum laeve TaxID=68775 RepID=A0A5C3LXR0_9AGAR|nr:hypothetical protein BDQ12DRAFT_609412 [Crucibulum laeve]
MLSASATPSFLPNINDPALTRTSYLSSTITSLLACITPMLGLMYLVALSWTYRYARRNPRPLNKTSGVRLQRFAPLVYVFLVLSSLAEVAIASWLLLQYRFHGNYPNVIALRGTRLVLFSACWTSLTAGAYTLLFLHPTWSKHPISSIGTQAIWVFATWVFWIAGAAVINASVPGLLVGGSCDGVIYCGQIRALFGMYMCYSVKLSEELIFKR